MRIKMQNSNFDLLLVVVFLICMRQNYINIAIQCYLPKFNIQAITINKGKSLIRLNSSVKIPELIDNILIINNKKVRY